MQRRRGRAFDGTQKKLRLMELTRTLERAVCDFYFALGLRSSVCGIQADVRERSLIAMMRLLRT